jgi:hypothetical protein
LLQKSLFPLVFAGCFAPVGDVLATWSVSLSNRQHLDPDLIGLRPPKSDFCPQKPPLGTGQKDKNRGFSPRQRREYAMGEDSMVSLSRTATFVNTIY